MTSMLYRESKQSAIAEALQYDSEIEDERENYNSDFEDEEDEAFAKDYVSNIHDLKGKFFFLFIFSFSIICSF